MTLSLADGQARGLVPEDPSVGPAGRQAVGVTPWPLPMRNDGEAVPGIARDAAGAQPAPAASRRVLGYSGGSRYARPGGAWDRLPSIRDMTSVEQTAGHGAPLRARPEVRGTASLVLGAVALVMIVFPLLLQIPGPLWVRFFPWLCIAPAGIGAVVSGLVVLHQVQGRRDVDAFRARMGITLGTVAVVLPAGVLLWAIWALNQAVSA